MPEAAAGGGAERHWPRPEWLPEGWAMELKQRKDGRSDKYFVDPEKTHVFRSKTDVIYYLEYGEIRKGVIKWIPKSFKSSRELLMPRQSNNQGSIVRQSLFVDPTSSCEELQKESAELSSQKTHLQNSGGHDPLTDLNNSGTPKSLVDGTNKTSGNQHSLSDGNSESLQGMDTEQMAGKSSDLDSIPVQIYNSAPFALKQQNDPTKPSILNRKGSITYKPVKKKPPNTAPLRRSLRNKGGNANLPSEADLSPSKPSQILPSEPIVMKYGMQVEIPSKQVMGRLNKADKESKELKDEVSQMEVDLRNEPVGTHQDHSFLGNTYELSKGKLFESTNEKWNSPKDIDLGSEAIDRMGLKTQPNDALLQHSELKVKMVPSKKLGVREDATHPANDKEHDQKAFKLADGKVSVMLSDAFKNPDIHVKREISVVVEANKGLIKQATDKLPEFEKQLVAGTIPSSAAQTPAEKASKPLKQSRGQQSNKTKTNAAPYLPPRASRRLAGFNMGPTVKIDSEWSLKKLKPGAVVSSNLLTPIDLETQQIISNNDSTNTNSILMPAPASSKIVEEKEARECKKPESQRGPVSAESEQKKSESSMPFPFGDTWPDPCIEFAFKTLTGDLPIFEEIIAIENFFHQHLTPAKKPSQNNMPSFSFNFNFMPPEIPIQFEDMGRLNTNSGRTNQECSTLKNGLQSPEMNGRLKRAKMN